SAKIADVKAAYDKYGAFLIIAKGFTPIPFKLVTIVSGALEYNFALFVILSILPRGARFFVLAVLFNRFGEPMQRFVEKRLGLVTLTLLGIIVIGFYATGKLV
ncbi:MAG: YqaA family protein, partial [Dolichospermum sp.]